MWLPDPLKHLPWIHECVLKLVHFAEAGHFPLFVINKHESCIGEVHRTGRYQLLKRVI